MRYNSDLSPNSGNYCPICQKCYSDDDWEAKRVQCCTCESWVHAKCENFTDEMYQLLSYLPDEVAFNCQKCCPMRPPPWESIIKDEMQAGIRLVLKVLLGSKSAQHLKIDKEVSTYRLPFNP